MSWQNTIKKEFDEHGRDFDEQGLDQDGKPLPKDDNFLEDIELMIRMYKGRPDTFLQLKYIKEILLICKEEIKLREA